MEKRSISDYRKNGKRLERDNIKTRSSKKEDLLEKGK